MIGDLRSRAVYDKTVIIGFESSIDSLGHIYFDSLYMQHVTSGCLSSSHIFRGVIDFNCLVNTEHLGIITSIPRIAEQFLSLFENDQFYFCVTSLEQQIICYKCFNYLPSVIPIPPRNFETIFGGASCVLHPLSSSECIVKCIIKVCEYYRARFASGEIGYM